MFGFAALTGLTNYVKEDGLLALGILITFQSLLILYLDLSSSFTIVAVLIHC